MSVVKQWSKRLSRAGARWGMHGALWLIEHLPFVVVRGFLNLVFSAAFRFTSRLRKIARETMDTAYGDELTPAQKEQILKDCFKTIRKSMIELLYYSRYPDRITEGFSIEGQEHLDAALSQGKGAVLATAHFGNFPLMILTLAKMGYPANVIMRRARDTKIADVILKIMDRVKVRTIYTQPRRACVLECLKVLRNNELLFILMDQNFGSDGGVFVDFFGRKAATATGAVVIANRTGAPLLPAFCIRQEGMFRHKIFIEPAMPLELRATNEEALQANVAALTRVIEGYIRRYPHEWGWMHRRWKTQAADAVPAGDIAVGEETPCPSVYQGGARGAG